MVAEPSGTYEQRPVRSGVLDEFVSEILDGLDRAFTEAAMGHQMREAINDTEK